MKNCLSLVCLQKFGCQVDDPWTHANYVRTTLRVFSRVFMFMQMGNLVLHWQCRSFRRFQAATTYGCLFRGPAKWWCSFIPPNKGHFVILTEHTHCVCQDDCRPVDCTWDAHLWQPLPEVFDCPFLGKGFKRQRDPSKSCGMF